MSLKFEATAVIRGPGGVTEAPLADKIIADDMQQALKITADLIAWPHPPLTVIQISIKESK